MIVERKLSGLDGHYVVSIHDINGKTFEYGKLFDDKEDFESKKEEFERSAEEAMKRLGLT